MTKISQHGPWTYGPMLRNKICFFKQYIKPCIQTMADGFVRLDYAFQIWSFEFRVIKGFMIGYCFLVSKGK